MQLLVNIRPYLFQSLRKLQEKQAKIFAKNFLKNYVAGSLDIKNYFFGGLGAINFFLTV